MKELVLFGVTGDLAKQKLIPALFNLYKTGKIDRKTSFIGFGRKQFSKSDFQNFIDDVVHAKSKSKMIREFSAQWSYVESELNSIQGYVKLAGMLVTNETIVYVSLPPSFQYEVCSNLISSGVVSKGTNRKIALEKPFGFDAPSSVKLEKFLTRKLKDQQILRVDHYAGKQALVELEQVAKQGILDTFLSGKNISKIEVKLNESIDVATRGSFYDAVGALNDVGQNHVLHMLATILAIPESTASNCLSKLRSDALSLVEIDTKGKKPVLAQYEAFNTTPGVLDDSVTETFFRIFAKLKKGKHVLSKRWGNVQIELVGGKALKNSEASITLYSKQKNVKPIVIRVNGYGSRDAYEQIFIDAFFYNEDRFIEFNQIYKGWQIIEKIKKTAGLKKNKITMYKRGSYPQDISSKS